MNTKVPSPSVTRHRPQVQFSVPTALVALRCWWRTALPAALLLSVVAGAAVVALHKPTYTAETWLLIKSKPDVVLREVASDPGKFIPNQMEIIRSPRLLGALTNNPEVLETPELRNRRDPTAALAERIRITPRGDSEIYILSFSSSSPEKAEYIVRQVTDAYIAFNRELESEQSDQIIRLLEDQRAARYQEMCQLREEVRALSIELTGVDPFRSSTSQQNITLKQSPAAELQAEIIRREVEQDVLAARLKAEEENQATDSAEPTEREIEQEIEATPSYAACQARIEQLKAKEAKFRRTGLNLENNFQFSQIQSELAMEVQTLEDLRVKLREQATQQLVKNQASARAARLTALRSDLKAGAARLKVLSARFNSQMGSAKDVTGDEIGLEFQRAKLEQVTRIHDEISSRILALTTERRGPDRVMTFKEPTRPIVADEILPWKKLALASMAAFALPFVFVIAWEHLFKRVVSPSQLEGASQLSVVREVSAPPSALSFCRRNGNSNPQVLLFEESVESLWAHFTLAESLREHRVLAFTSAVSREGKTSLSSQLAVSIARESGEPTLLIDGDMRSPDLQDIFGVEPTPGLAELLRKECGIADALKATVRDNLHVMPAGQLTTSPRRLLRKETFRELIQELRHSYRYIVLDTPPILSASESLVIAHAADAAVICLRCDFSRVDQVNEAHTRMLAAGINVVGGVLNGVPLSRYAFKYGVYSQNRVHALAD